jgi:hypothetical protein
MLASPAPRVTLNLNGLALASNAIISFLETTDSNRWAFPWKSEAPLAITLPPKNRLNLPVRMAHRDH